MNPFYVLNTPIMAVFWDFCTKNISDKSQFKVPKDKKSEKIKELFYINF